ncbi:MAG: hypothetical protein JWP18_259 [Solirubrobacterales bacterium]|nr:hypothetical protein [Solirubrobacterales bacterium]
MPPSRNTRTDRATQPRRPAPSERRTVRSQDPSLSAEANDLVTREVRQAVGGDAVRVPAGAPDRATTKHGGHNRSLATLASIRPFLIVVTCMLLIVAGIVALSSDEYVVLIAVFALLVLCLTIVAMGAIQLTTQTEHAHPEVAARLEAEGVADPDRMVNELVEDYAGNREAHGTPEVIAGGHNDSDARGTEEPGVAAVQQRTAWTPTSARTREAGADSVIEALPWWVSIGMMVASVVGAIAADGGRFWAAPAIVVPLGVLWIALQRWMRRESPGGDAESHRPAGDSRSALPRLAPISIGAVVLVVLILTFLGAVANLL